ncbi:hypothetical protein [Paenibacillus lautus]|uniref:hypothetical protein n=1 Tax=Paenibacillus lautus TaxID=1401 RepID=UPI003D27C194
MSPLLYDIEMKFKEDWKNHLISLLNEYGYTINPNLSPSDVSIIYFNWRRRVVDITKRKVHVSKEFNCPKKYKYALREIINKIERGFDINPHLSKLIKDVKYNDLLLNDWGIHHLHLSKKYTDSSKKFVDRTKDVLFVKFNQENAYLIQILDHKSFSDQELLKIMHRNWPDIMRRLKIDSLSHSLTNEDIHNIRKNGGNAFIEVEPGVVYMPPGMGLTTARTSTEATRNSHYYMNNLSLFELHMRNNIGSIIREAETNSVYKMPKKLKFVLHIYDTHFKAVEVNTNVVVDLGTL